MLSCISHVWMEKLIKRLPHKPKAPNLNWTKIELCAQKIPCSTCPNSCPHTTQDVSMWWVTLLPRAGDRHCLKFWQGKYMLDIRNNSYSVRVVWHWHRLPTEWEGHRSWMWSRTVEVVSGHGGSGLGILEGSSSLCDSMISHLPGFLLKWVERVRSDLTWGFQGCCIKHSTHKVCNLEVTQKLLAAIFTLTWLKSHSQRCLLSPSNLYGL